MSKLLTIFVLLFLLIGTSLFAQTVLNPCIVGAVDTDGHTAEVFVSGSHAYVADWAAGMKIIDISEPTNPVIVGSVDTDGSAQRICVSGDYAYVADGDMGLKVIDVSDPTDPVIVGFLATDGQVKGVFVFGSYVCVANGWAGMEIIDVSNPTNPAVVGSVELYGMYCEQVFVSGSYAYVAHGVGGVEIVDVSDPTDPVIIGSTFNAVAQAVFVSGNYAYVANSSWDSGLEIWDSRLEIFDVSNPASPTSVGSVDTEGGSQGVFVSGDYAYVADQWAGIKIIDISTPSNPVIVGSLDTMDGITMGVFVSGDYIYVSDWIAGLKVIQDDCPVLEPLDAEFYYHPEDSAGYVPEVPHTVWFYDRSDGSPTSWLWDFGDGNTSTEQNPTHTYTIPGVYSVRLDIAHAYDSDFLIKTDYITVISNLKALFAASPRSGALPLIVQFTDNSTVSPTSWSWNFGDGQISTEQNPIHVYTTVGNYAVSLTVQSSTGPYTKTVNNFIRVVTPIVAKFTGTPTSGLQSLAVQFSDQSTGNPYYWSWDFGDGFTSTEQNPNHTYTTSGTYTVSLNARKAYTSNTIVKTNYITVLAPLQAEFSADTTEGTSPLVIQFTDQSEGQPTSWLWNFGDGQTSIERNPSHTYTVHGVYSVRLDVANSYDADPIIKTNYIVVLEPLQAGFSADTTSGASPLIVYFTDQSKGNPTTWLWSFGDGEMSASQNPIHAYMNQGLYTVSLTVSDGNISDTKVINDYIAVDITTDIDDNDPGSNLPDNFVLQQNYPNPFNPTTEINFALPTVSQVKLEIFNIEGKRVALLIEDKLSAGEHSITWDGSAVASGIYLYKLSAGDFVETKKMVLLK